MRSLIVATIILGTLPVIFMKPHVGILVFSWISYMNPHRMTWGFAYDFRFAFIVAAVTIAAWLISREPKKLPWNSLSALTIAMMIWVSLTSFFAVHPEAAVDPWLKAIKILVMTLLTMILINNRERLTAFLWVVVASIGYFAIKGGLFTILTGGESRIFGPPDSYITENNGLALATIMVVPLAKFMADQAEVAWVRWAVRLALPLAFISIIASYSRGAFLATFAMVVFLWLKSRKKLIGAVALLAILVGVFSFMPDKYFERIETIQTYEEDTSAMSRINAWLFAFNMAKDRPVFGGGWGSFDDPALWSRYAPDPEDIKAPHSSYFEMIGRHGFPGLALFILLLLLSFRVCTTIIQSSRDHPDLDWASGLARMCQVSVIGYAVGSAFLNFAFFDLYWHIVAIIVITKVIVDRTVAERAAELAVPGRAPPPPERPAAIPAARSGHAPTRPPAE